MTLPTPVHELELRAIAAYRSKYPNGIPWQELHRDTRVIWLRAIEEVRK